MNSPVGAMPSLTATGATSRHPKCIKGANTKIDKTTETVGWRPETSAER